MNDDFSRIDALDFLRGLAVMGILLANVTVFGLPDAASFSPYTVGTDGPLDLAVWAFNLLLVDGKFRALFAIMFGASMLLVMERAEMDGRDGFIAHRRRMLTLLPIGLAHYLLIWSGDILMTLAVAGLIATRFVSFEPLTLLKWALGLLAVQWLIDLAAVLPPHWHRDIALAPGAANHVVAHWNLYEDLLGGDNSRTVAAEVTRMQGGYGGIFLDRLTHLPGFAVDIMLYALPEMLAYMALGMAMLKGGFLAGQWRPDQYRATWVRAYLVGLLPMAALAVWVLASGDILAAQTVAFGWSMPLRLPLAVGHAALAMELAGRLSEGRLVVAVRSVGRLALSNYLLCSLVMTTLFYGYGFGLFARVDRAVLMLVAVLFWFVMLSWSIFWRKYSAQGPAERLWRFMARRTS